MVTYVIGNQNIIRKLEHFLYSWWSCNSDLNVKDLRGSKSLDSPVDALCLYLHIYLPESTHTHLWKGIHMERDDVRPNLAEDQAEPIERTACEMMKKILVCHWDDVQSTSWLSCYIKH